MSQALTLNEERVLHIVKRQCRLGDPVATADVRRLARPISYDAVDGALRKLVDKQLIAKPSRGFYLPTAMAA